MILLVDSEGHDQTAQTAVYICLKTCFCMVWPICREQCLHVTVMTVYREQYRRDAQRAYQEKMLAAHVGKTDFPKIRTFNKSEASTNSVYKDLEAAEKL